MCMDNFKVIHSGAAIFSSSVLQGLSDSWNDYVVYLQKYLNSSVHFAYTVNYTRAIIFKKNKILLSHLCFKCPLSTQEGMYCNHL